jgi:hypothetical protein
MMVVSAMGGGGGDPAEVLVSLLWRVTLAAVALFLLMRYVLPWAVALMARSQELLLIFAIAWGVGLAALGEWAGFSKEAGAFLAGFSLASTSYRDAISARLTGIRDFLLLFFFIDLGARLDFSTLGGELCPALVLSLFVLIGNPLIVMAIMGYMGYGKRTGFLAGLTVAQISEFSIIFIAMGISLGHVDTEALGLVTLVGVTTIAVSTYMILYSHPLYERLAPWLGPFERRNPQRELVSEQEAGSTRPADVIVLGLGRYGARLAQGLEAAGLAVVGVDFDPESARAWRSKGLAVRYGDATEAELLESLPLASRTWVVSTLPDVASNRGLVQALRTHHYTGELAIVARADEDGLQLKRLGVPTVIYPTRNAVDFAVENLAGIIRRSRERQRPDDAVDRVD